MLGGNLESSPLSGTRIVRSNDILRDSPEAPAMATTSLALPYVESLVSVQCKAEAVTSLILILLISSVLDGKVGKAEAPESKQTVTCKCDRMIRLC